MGNSESKTGGRKKNKQGGEEFLAQILQDILIEMKQSNANIWQTYLQAYLLH